MVITGCGSIEIVQLLIDKGANIEAIARHNKTPLHYRSWSTVWLLFEEGAEKTFKNITTVHQCISLLFSVLLKKAILLAEMRAGIDIKNHINESHYQTALAKIKKNISYWMM